MHHVARNKTTFRHEIWAGLRAERITTMLAHLRRCANEPVRCERALKGCETKKDPAADARAQYPVCSAGGLCAKHQSGLVAVENFGLPLHGGWVGGAGA
jgi:hypothetical protein